MHNGPAICIKMTRFPFVAIVAITKSTIANESVPRDRRGHSWGKGGGNRPFSWMNVSAVMTWSRDMSHIGPPLCMPQQPIR